MATFALSTRAVKTTDNSADRFLMLQMPESQAEALREHLSQWTKRRQFLA